MPGFVQCVKTQHAVGTLFSSYTTAKRVINDQAAWPVPGGYLQVGDRLIVRAEGAISNVVTTQPTFTFQCMMGSTIIHTTGAILTTTSAHVTIPFFYEARLTLDSEGSGTAAKFRGQAKLEGQMFLYSSATADSTLGLATIMGPNTAPALGTGYDSTITNVFDFFVGLSVNGATTGIQIQQYDITLFAERN